MIYSPAHGDTAFTVPLFDDFLRREMPSWTPPGAAVDDEPAFFVEDAAEGDSA
jgi:hypothetical protein